MEWLAWRVHPLESDATLKPAILDAAAEPLVVVCRNCNATATGNYCHNCGQETRLHAPSFGEFLHEFVGHYVALEGRLWGTIGRLLFRPGALTNEYLAGRRRRFVEPLRLYLTLSIIFFALLKFSGMEPVQMNKAKMDKESMVALHGDATEEDVSISKALQLQKPGEEKGKIAQIVDRFDRMPSDQKVTVLKDSFYRYAPYGMFLLMPVFAVYLKLLYLGSGRRYGEHLLFALHTNSFAFFMFAALLYLPEGFMKGMLWLWVIGYLPWAMRRVYNKGRFGTFWRWVVLAILHSLSLAFAVLGVMAMGVAFAH
jgi:Protein of unknown function (DUF3667)